MEIYKPGTKILINDTITGIITQVVLAQSGTWLYKCAWWNGAHREEDFLYESEFFAGNIEKQKIGFKCQ